MPRNIAWPTVRAGLALAVFAALVVIAACSGGRTTPPRHVVLIVVDTLRADHLTTYGYRRPTSPVIDELAREGAVFERAVSQGSWTQPSMVSMMAGAYIADELQRVPTGRATLAQAMQQAGYATAAFIHNDMLSRESNFDPGFDIFDYQDPPYGGIEKVSAWFQANRGKRSFTFVHLNEAHDPYDPPADFDRFVHEKDSLSAERQEYLRSLAKQMGLTDTDASLRRINEEVGGYDDDVRYSDAHIGRILSALKQNGEWDQTAVVIAADHGEGLWTRPEYLTGKRLNARKKGESPTLLNTLLQTHGAQVSRELVHVPLIMVAPGMPRGVRVEPWVENVDITPTLLELCDIAVPDGVQGVSLVSLWRDPENVALQKRGAFSHTRYVSSFIDQNGYQLILPTDRGECEFGLKVELFHLRTDPDARVDLSAREPERVAALRREIESRLKHGMTAREAAQTSMSPTQIERLAALGYLDGGVVDAIDAENQARSVEELLASLEDPKNVNCLVRILAARELARRKLDEPSRQRLRDLRAKEVSSAIQRVFDEALDS